MERAEFKNMIRPLDLGKPVVVADAGLLSKASLEALEQEGSHYIIGARIKMNQN